AIFTAQHVRVRRFGKRAKHAPYARTLKISEMLCDFLKISMENWGPFVPVLGNCLHSALFIREVHRAPFYH
ncbi:MAG: hypothetical protein O7C59_05590, partial [Rickettsia endosymbiont of Ixodes persulcatus]|nr:hypothetical protein [Rickettsia endosymbiont of Ixodes persulcatus]